jgi:tRNA threonylcarbamoyladenosine biosynthesis protein TsaB
MSKPGMILCLETATTNCSVALSFEGKQVALIEDYDVKYSHAERLHRYIEEVLALAKATKEDLVAIAVSKGPGSYTGLRIGVSAAKGLSFALDVPLISIPTLQSLAMQVAGARDALIIPMLDARRMEVYSAVFDHESNLVRETQAEILGPEHFAQYLEQGKVTFLGSGVPKFSEICEHPNAIFVEDKLPSAAQICDLAYQKYLQEDFENVAYFEPYYLKDFIAGVPKKK